MRQVCEMCEACRHIQRYKKIFKKKGKIGGRLRNGSWRQRGSGKERALEGEV